MPIKALEPVALYTQYPIATLYITSPSELTALPCKSRTKSLFQSLLFTVFTAFRIKYSINSTLCQLNRLRILPQGKLHRVAISSTVGGFLPAKADLVKKAHLPCRCAFFWRCHPDLNWGWRCCRPLPYRLAMAPLFVCLNIITKLFCFVKGICQKNLKFFYKLDFYT